MSRYKPSDYETRTPLFGFRRIADRLRPLPVTSLRRNRHGRPLPDHRRRNGPRDAGPESGEVGNLLGLRRGVAHRERSDPHPTVHARSLGDGVVRHAYFEKAVKYVRTRGRVAFDQGGEIQDVLWLVDRYGIVPQSLYEGGAADGTYDHASLAKAIRRLAKRIVDKNCMKREHWQRMIDEELDRRLGARPDRFVIDGGCLHAVFLCRLDRLPADDYAALTSFTHHPFFERFVLEIPDNWAAHATLNIPLDSLMRLLDSALAAGYTAAWDADVSERGFGRRAGIALLPQQEGRITLPAPEIVVDQPPASGCSTRRPRPTTTSCTSSARPSIRSRKQLLQGENSWGERAGRHGYWYASPAYVAGKTIELVLPCAALGVDPGDDAFPYRTVRTTESPHRGETM